MHLLHPRPGARASRRRRQLACASPIQGFRWIGGRRLGPGLAGGLIAGAVIGGIASSAYAYGPGYGYYGDYAPAYYGGYAPAYYGEYSYYDDYAPVYGYRYRRVIRPAFAYYVGPRYYGGWHHRWHRHW